MFDILFGVPHSTPKDSQVVIDNLKICLEPPAPSVVGGVHFSIDDVFQYLGDFVSPSAGSSSVVGMAQRLFVDYGITTHLNVFDESPYANSLFRSLADIPSIEPSARFLDYFRFAPHARSNEVPPYSQSLAEGRETLTKVYSELTRIFSRKWLSQYVRLHHYSECYELSDLLLSYGAHSIFTTDKPIGSHRLASGLGQILRNKGYLSVNGIMAIRTDFRTELLYERQTSDEELFMEIDKILSHRSFIVIYGHEYEYLKKHNLYDYTISVIERISNRIMKL